MLNSQNTLPQSLGGQIMAIKQRQNAEKKYFQNPKICLFCSNIISITNKKISEVKKKKFCNHTCAAKYRNLTNSPKPSKIKKQKESNLFKITKGELFKNSKNWQSARSTIQRMARKIFNESNKQKKCSKCEYSLHYEVCHIKPVSEFPDHETILEINKIENLIALCPNHHWEHDNIS